MSNIPDDLKYTESHEWLRERDDGAIEIGITDHAQETLGDLVFVETPEVGDTIAAGEVCATVESVKSASDVYSPIGGEIVEVNEALADAPESINEDPYGQGWLARIRPADSSSLDDFMDAAAYRDYCDQDDD